MTDREQVVKADGERPRAEERLDQAVSARSRLRDKSEAAQGTPDELKADASLRNANEQVVARERWLNSVEDHHYA